MYRRKQRTDYYICPYCGCSLDVGEKCDCRQNNKPVNYITDKLVYLTASKRKEVLTLERDQNSGN